MRKLLVGIRSSVKIICLIVIGIIISIAVFAIIYKPTYSVTLNGEFLGYSEDKSKLQKKINTYIEKGDGTNVAFVQIDDLPEYTLCLLKKDIVTNDNEVFEKVKETGVVYYKYYAITNDGNEVAYTSTYNEGEQVIEALKEKNSQNVDTIGLVEKYETTLVELASVEDIVAKTYEAKVIATKKTTKKTINTTTTKTNEVVIASNMTSGKASVGNISFVKPVSGTLSSRFGRRSSGVHTGLDIAAPKGTTVIAASGGTVTYSGYKGSYGNLVIISHGNGVETYYAHNSALNVSTGDKVAQGQVISKVGSTGRSTGSHLHLEIRVGGKPQNPQNYLY